jgi:serine protease Do
MLILRTGDNINIKMIIGDWDNATRVRKNKTAQLNELGLTLISLTEKVRSQFNIRWDVEGAAVSIVDTSKGISEAIKRGDVIIQVNQHKIWKPDQIIKYYKEARDAGRKTIIMLVLRNSGFVFVILPVRQLL